MTNATKPTDTETHRLRDGYEQARHVAADAFETSKAKVRTAAHATGETIDANPLGLLVGGLAVGAAIGALLPRPAFEKKALAPIGRKLNETARAAAQAARAAGYAELDERGLTRSAAKDQAKSMVEGVFKALSTAGTAAAQTAAQKADAETPAA